MASTYISLHVHVVFATKGRQPWIASSWRGRLHAYMGGVLRGLGTTPVAVGGIDDHVHLLIGMKATHAVADTIRELKKASTEWIRSEVGLTAFRWQEGYAAFSVGLVDPVVAYIENQEAHHQKRDSARELRALFEEAGIEVDPRYFE